MLTWFACSMSTGAEFKASVKAVILQGASAKVSSCWGRPRICCKKEEALEEERERERERQQREEKERTNKKADDRDRNETQHCGF